MKIDKLLKRFMKDNGVFGSSASRETISFLYDFEEAMMPFNSFRWDSTEQGHNYWYSKSMQWVLFLYDNLNAVDEEDKKKYTIDEVAIKYCLYDLINFYCIEGSKVEDLEKIEPFKDVQSLYNKLSEKEAKEVDIHQKEASF